MELRKKLLGFFICSVVIILLNSCLKDAKDALEDIEQRTRCAELLADFTTNGGDQTCEGQIADIDIILRDCDQFLTQDQKDELNLAKENCSDDG